MYLLRLFKRCLRQAGLENILGARGGGQHVLNDGEEGVVKFCERSAHSACFLSSMHIDGAIIHHLFIRLSSVSHRRFSNLCARLQKLTTVTAICCVREYPIVNMDAGGEVLLCERTEIDLSPVFCCTRSLHTRKAYVNPRSHTLLSHSIIHSPSIRRGRLLLRWLGGAGGGGGAVDIPTHNGGHIQRSRGER